MSRNFAWLFADRVVRLGIGFVVATLIARSLGPDQFGGLAYALALVALVGAIVPLGLETIVRRAIVELPRGAGSILATNLAMRASAFALCLVVVLVTALASPEEDRGVIIAAAGAMLTPVAGLFEAVLEVRWRGRLAFFARMIPTVFGAVLRLGMLAVGASVEAFAWAVTIEAVVGLVSAVSAVRWARVIRTAWTPRWEIARGHLAESWPLLLSSLAVLTYSRIDQIMLRNSIGTAEVGVFSAAVRITEVAHFLPVLLASTALPLLVRARGADGSRFAELGQRFLDLNAAVAICIAIVVSLGAPLWIGIIYGPSFGHSVEVLRIHAWSTVFVFLGVARGQLLTLERATSVQLGATILGALINVGLNLLLIPRHGALGAAWSTVAAQATAAWLALGVLPGTRGMFHRVTAAILIPVRGWIYLWPRPAGRRPAGLFAP